MRVLINVLHVLIPVDGIVECARQIVLRVAVRSVILHVLAYVNIVVISTV